MIEGQSIQVYFTPLLLREVYNEVEGASWCSGDDGRSGDSGSSKVSSISSKSDGPKISSISSLDV